MLDLLDQALLEQMLRLAYGDDMRALAASPAARVCKRLAAATRGAATTATVDVAGAAQAAARCRGLQWLAYKITDRTYETGDDFIIAAAAAPRLIVAALGARPPDCGAARAWPRLRRVEVDVTAVFSECVPIYRPNTRREVAELVRALAALQDGRAPPPAVLPDAAAAKQSGGLASPPPPQAQGGLLELSVELCCLEPAGQQQWWQPCTLAEALAALAKLRGLETALIRAIDTYSYSYNGSERDEESGSGDHDNDKDGGALRFLAVTAPALEDAGPRELTLELWGLSERVTPPAPGALGAWLAPLTRLAPRLESLELSSRVRPVPGRSLPDALAAIAQLTRLTSLRLTGTYELAMAPPPGAGGGGGGGGGGSRPVPVDLSPLQRLARLEEFELEGGSASIHRLATFRTIVAPLTRMPARRAVKLCLFGRRWRFESGAAMSAEELRRWVADERCQPTGIRVTDT